MDEFLPFQDTTVEEARFFEFSLDIFFISDLDGTILRVNRAVERLLGYQPDELIGRSLFDFVHAENLEAVRTELSRLREGHNSESFECRVVSDDGAYRWFSVTVPSPSPGSDRLYGVARDVTQQKQTEQGLLEWKNRYDAATTVSRNIVYEWNTETDDIVWAGKPEQLLGYASHELPTDVAGWLEMIHPDDRFDAERVVAHVLAAKAPTHLQYRVRRNDGEYTHIRDDAQYIHDADGRFVRMVGVITDISKETLAEEGLRSVADAASSAVLLINSQGRVFFSNAVTEQAFGYSRQELAGIQIEQLIPARFRERHQKHAAAFLRDPQRREMAPETSLVVLHRDGREIPVEIRLTPVPFGSDVMVACTILESTPVRQVQRALQESEQRFRSILDGSAVIYVKDIDGRYLLANRQFEELFGVRDSDLVGKTDYELFPRETADAFRRNDRRVVETGEVLRLEEIAPHDDFPHNYVSVKFPLRDAAGRINAVAGISTDITDLVRTRREVEQLTHRLELILNSVTDGIFGVDLQGEITFANRAAARMFEYSASELIGMQQRAITDAASSLHRPVVNAVDAALGGGVSSLVDDGHFRKPDGTTFPVEYVAAPVRENGEIIGAVVTFRDVTGRQSQAKVEHELRAARTLQQQLYPDRAPSLAGFDIAGAAVPAAMAGGDYYDFIPLTDDKIALAVGDVSGHGLSSALEMIEVRAYLRAILSAEQDSSTVLERLNRFLIGDTLEGSFVSLFLAQLDASTRTFSYIGAGHDARLLRANGDAEILFSSGLVLGVVPNLAIPRSTSLHMNQGDVLVMVTDGITEAHSPSRELFGYTRVLDVVRANRDSSAEDIIKAIYAEVSDFSEGRPLNDDMTAMIVRSL